MESISFRELSQIWDSKTIILVFFLVVTSKQAHPPVPISEFAHYVNEMKEKDNGEFNKEFEVRTKIDLQITYISEMVRLIFLSSKGITNHPRGILGRFEKARQQEEKQIRKHCDL